MWLVARQANNAGTIFGSPNVQNSAQFLTTFDFVREYLLNGSTNRKSEKYLINGNLYHVVWKRWWSLVHKRKSYWRAYWPTQVDIFRETVFRQLGFMCPQSFACTKARLASAHPKGDGIPPPQSVNRENLKFGLKFSVCVCAPITSGKVTISSRNLSRWLVVRQADNVGTVVQATVSVLSSSLVDELTSD